MKEFMLLIRTEGDCAGQMEPEFHKAHVQRVIRYIDNLSKQGRLKGAQPLTMNGSILEGKNGVFKDGPFNETKEVIAGYFIFLAHDLNEAKEIAKAHPLFNDSDDVRIEVREIKYQEGINS